MRKLSVVVLGIAALVRVSAHTQAPPVDLAGTWVLDASKSHTETIATRVQPSPTGIQPPLKVRDVRPAYPPDALSAKFAGSPILQAIIDRDGFIADLRVVRSVPRLDQAAVDAVWQWEYSPTMSNGSPQEVMLTVLVTFSVAGAMQNAVGTPVPPPPLKDFGTGLGLGQVSTQVSIAQDAKKIVLTRELGGPSQKVTYTPGQNPVTNKLKNYGSAKDNAYTYKSQWDDGKLVTEISWSGPQRVRTAREVVSRTGDALTIVTSRPDATTGGDAFIQTLVYTRKQ